MRQKKEFYDKDQKTKNARVDELENQMKRDANDSGFYGKLKIGE
jgi:hypothetical protein